MEIGRNTKESKKCVVNPSPCPLECASDAGDQGKRLNYDNLEWDIRLHVFTDWDHVKEELLVCAQRTDGQGEHWEMNLEVKCKVKELMVDVGSTKEDKKCVGAYQHTMKCRDISGGYVGFDYSMEYSKSLGAYQVCVKKTPTPWYFAGDPNFKRPDLQDVKVLCHRGDRREGEDATGTWNDCRVDHLHW